MYTFLLLGDAKTGKTTLIKRFRGQVNEEFFRLNPYYKTTTVTKYGEKERDIHIIDTPGSHAKVNDWNKGEMETVDCVVFSFVVDDSRSLANLWFWYQVFEDAMGKNASQIRRLVIATKCDSDCVIEDTIMDLVNSFNDSINATFLRTSANKDLNVNKTFEIPKEIKHDKSTAQEGPISVHKNVLQRLISPTPSEVKTTDRIEDIAFSPDGIIMTSSEYMLKWDFLSQPNFGETAIEISDEDKPIRLRNPSYPFLATNSDDEEKPSWMFQRITDRNSHGIEAHFQPEMLHTKCIKDIAICTRCLHCIEHEDRPFVFMELFANGQLDERAGISGLKAEMSHYHCIKSLDVSPSHITAISSKDKPLYKNGVLQCQKEYERSLKILEVRSIFKVEQVACGLGFTVILIAKKAVFAWGNNDYGQLGLGHTNKRPKLDPSCKVIGVTKEKNENVLAISAGFYHAAARTDKGRLREWGLGVKLGKNQNESFLCSPQCSRGKRLNKVTSMCCGAFHTLCIEEYLAGYKPYVFARGKGNKGQLGTGELKDSETESDFIRGELYKPNTVIQVAAGYEHSALLTSSGEVYTCGNNMSGQLGYLTTDEENPEIRKVEFGEELRIEKIMCREDCTVAIGEKGETFMWGAASYHGAVTSSFSELFVDDEQQELVEMVLCPVKFGEREIEMTVALTQKNQIAIVEIRDKNDVISLKKSPCLISTNLKAPINLCYVEGYLIALDQNEKLLYCDFESQIIYLSQNNEKQDSAAATVTYKTKPKEEIPEAFSTTVFALNLRNKRSEIDFEIVEISRHFKEICATRRKLFLLSDLGDVFRLDIQKTKTKPQADLSKIKKTSTSSMAKLILVYKLPERNKAVIQKKKQTVRFVFHEHIELAHKVAIQLVCGPNHAEVLTKDGGIFVKSDRLRFEQFKIQEDQKESNNIKKITCGEVHTAALTEEGRVFMWQYLPKSPLSRSKGTKEKVDATKQRESNVNPEAEQCSCIFDFSDIRRSPNGDAVALEIKPYKIRVDLCSKDVHLNSKPKVLVSNVDKSDKSTKVNFCNVNENFLEGWFSFPKSGTFEISGFFLGQPIPKGQLDCQVSASVAVETCKLVLLGPYSQNLNRDLKTKKGVLMRTNGDFKYQVWAMDHSSEDPMSTESFLSQDLLSMLCVTDRAEYLYALDVKTFTLYSLERLKVWLQYLNYKAPTSKVSVVEINEFEDLSILNLQELRKINPNVQDANVIDSVTPEKILDIVDQYAACGPLSKRIHKNVIDLETKITECRKEKHYLTQKEFSQMAKQCGLEIYWQISEAAQYLQEAGIALFFGFAEFYLLLNWSDEWLASFVKLIKNKSPKGILRLNQTDDDVEMSYVINALVQSGIAFHSAQNSAVHYIPLLFVPLPHSVWPKVSQLPSSRIAVIHLVYDKDPLDLYVTFPELCKKIEGIRGEDDVCFGRFSMVFRIPEDQNIEAKIECGPHDADNGQTEIRLTVRALHTEKVSPLTMVEHLLSLTDQLRELEPTENVKVLCTKCNAPSFELNDAKNKVIVEGNDANLKCPYCKEVVLISDLLQGAEEKRPLPPLWKPIISKRKGCQEILLREILYRQKKHEKKSEERHLKIEKMLNQQRSEMKELFTQLRKFMIDLDENDTPALVQILPDSRSFLPKKWKSFKLYLWCEGDSTLMEPHPLDIKDHKGYKLPNTILVKCAKYIRLLLPVLYLLPFIIPVFGQISTPFAVFLALHISKKIPKDYRKWHETINKLDAYLAQMEEKNKVVSKLPENTDATLKITKSEYRHLKEFLKDADQKSNDPKQFGGLTKKEVEGRVIWVCSKCMKKT